MQTIEQVQAKTIDTVNKEILSVLCDAERICTREADDVWDLMLDSSNDKQRLNVRLKEYTELATALGTAKRLFYKLRVKE